MERMCGMLIPLVKSQIHPYANLWNNLILNEVEFYKHIFFKKKKRNGYHIEYLLLFYIMKNMNFIHYQKNMF